MTRWKRNHPTQSDPNPLTTPLWFLVSSYSDREREASAHLSPSTELCKWKGQRRREERKCGFADLSCCYLFKRSERRERERSRQKKRHSRVIDTSPRQLRVFSVCVLGCLVRFGGFCNEQINTKGIRIIFFFNVQNDILKRDQGTQLPCKNLPIYSTKYIA